MRFGKRFVLSGLCLLATMPAMSATFVVDAAGGGDFTTLDAAVNAAFTNSEADEIIVNPGLYVGVTAFVGEDEIVVRGSDPNDRPVIAVEPNFAELVPTVVGDGILISMNGSLTLEDLVIVPADAFSLDDGVDDLIAVVDHGGGASTLNLTLNNIVITHADESGMPLSLDGTADPRGSFNFTRDDALNIDAIPGDTVNAVLNNVIISAYGTEGGADSFVIDGPEVNVEIGAGSRFMYSRRDGIANYDSASMTINGTADNPVLVYGAATRPIRVDEGTHVINHLWVVGLLEGEGDTAINTGWLGRIDANTVPSSVTFTNCLFANAVNDGFFLNDDGEQRDITFDSCTFYNAPAVMRIGYQDVPNPPSDAISFSFIDCIFDSADAVAPGGAFFTPDIAVVDYGDGDNIGATVSISNIAYAEGFIESARSGSNSPTTSGTILEQVDFQFASTTFDFTDPSGYLVPTNCDVLAGQATGGATLDGARTSDCGSSVSSWDLY